MKTNKEWEEEFDNKISKHYSKVTCSEDNPMSPTKDVKNFIQSLLDKQKEEIAFDFLHKLQEKAKTVPPNLLLNESVNIAWEYKLSNKIKEM